MSAFPRVVYQARRTYWAVSPGVYQATMGPDHPPKGAGGYRDLAALCALKGDPDPRHVCKATAPDGAESFICDDAPGLTPDRAKATAFASRVAACAAASGMQGYGPVFWNSERESAKAARERFKGWRFEAEPVALVES